MALVDTHCHLQHKRFDEDRQAALGRAREVVDWLVVVGIDRESIREALDLAGGGVYVAAGYHPYNAADVNDETLAELRELAKDDRVKALGETGLDYFNEYCPRARQHEGFHKQAALACEVGLPLVIHNRDADEDCYQVLKDYAGDLRGCIMHCFSGDAAFAERCVDLGFHVSFAGNVTYPKAQQLRDAAAAVPLDRLLVETDAPYLAPQPARGKRCEPAFVKHTAVTVAEVKGLSPEELAEHTTRNACNLFGVG